MLFDRQDPCRRFDAYVDKIRRLADRGRVDSAAAVTVARNVHPTEDIRCAAPAFLVLEAVCESLSEKTRLFRQLHDVCGADAVFATSTASLSVTALGQASGRPDRFLGMQFFAPVPLIDLVELIPTENTSSRTLETAENVLRALRRTFLVSRDTPGFTVNRQIMPTWNEAFYLMEEGVAAQDIDAAMRLATEAPLGPLQLADYVGLDLLLSVMEALHRWRPDGMYAPCPKLRSLVAAGRLGRKTGEGVYRYV